MVKGTQGNSGELDRVLGGIGNLDRVLGAKSLYIKGLCLCSHFEFIHFSIHSLYHKNSILSTISYRCVISSQQVMSPAIQH